MNNSSINMCLNGQKLIHAVANRPGIGNYMEWFKTELKLSDLTQAKKKLLPMIKLIGYSKYQLVCADFDKLPDDLAGFDITQGRASFRERLKSKYTNHCIYLTSATGNTKLLFVVDSAHLENHTQAKLALSDLLQDSNLFDIVDKSKSSFTQCYFTLAMVAEFNRQVSTVLINPSQNQWHSLSTRIDCKDTNYCNGVTSQNQFNRFNDDTLKYVQMTSTLLKWIEAPVHNKYKELRIEFISILFAARSSLLKGIQALPSIALAKDLNVCRKTIGEYLSFFRETNLLKRTAEPSYRLNLATEYIAVGELEVIMKTIVLDKTKTKKSNSQILPNTIEEGNWNTESLKIVRHFHGDKTKILKHFRKIPGNNLNGRKKRILKQIEHYNPSKRLRPKNTNGGA